MIPLVKLHHVSFATKDLAASRQFFGGVLGLAEIPRPGFHFRGAWYALADRQLHIIENPGEESAGASRRGRPDHRARAAADAEAVRTTLRSHSIESQEGGNRQLGMEQIFCHDPDGHVIEFVRYEEIRSQKSEDRSQKGGAS